MRRARLARWLVLALVAAAAPARGEEQRPFSIEDMLRQESIGAVRVSPDGRWVVIERRAAWDAAPTYRYGFYTPWLLSRLLVVPVHGRQAARALRAPDGAEGYVAGPFSPDGRRMAVYGLSAAGWRLGVVALAGGPIRWLAVTPEIPRLGRTLAWRSDRELVAITRPDRSLPFLLRFSSQAQTQMRALWDRQAAGGVSAVYIPSGARRDERAHAPASQISLIDLHSGAVKALAEGEFFDLEVSPDGAAVAALRDAEDLQGRLAIPALTGAPTRRRRLMLIDIDHRRPIEPLPDHDLISHLLAWRADSARLLVFARKPGEEFEQGRFWSVSPAGQAEAIALGSAAPWLERSQEGIALAYGGWSADRPVLQVRSGAGERLWLSGPDQMAAAPGDVLVQTAAGPAISRAHGLFAFPDARRLASGRALDAGVLGDAGDRAMRNPDPIIAGAQPRIDQDHCLSWAMAGARVCPAPPAGDESLIAADPKGGFFITRATSARGATRLALHGSDGVRPLVRINPHLERRAWGEIRPIQHRGPDGQALTSWLLLPPLPKTAGAPLVILVYPGADYRSPPGWMRPGGERRHLNPAIFAGAGYAVLVPSLPDPSAGAGLRADLAARILAIADAAAQQEAIDASRIALVGHSFGAYGALLAATQSDRFAAVVASNGYADLSRAAELPAPWRVSPEDGLPIDPLWAWAETGQAAIGASFVAAPGAYVARSPLYAATRITAPSLLIESDLDGARLGSLFSALYRSNREAGLVTYFGEGHAYVSPGNLRDLHARVLSWLDRWLALRAPGPDRREVPSAPGRLGR